MSGGVCREFKKKKNSRESSAVGVEKAGGGQWEMSGSQKF